MLKTKKISRIEKIFTLITCIIGISIIYLYIFFSYLNNEEIIKPISKTKINQKSAFETHKLLKSEQNLIFLKDIDKNVSPRFKEKYQEMNKFKDKIKNNNFQLSILETKLKSLEEQFNLIENKKNDVKLKLQQEEDLNKWKELQIEQIHLQQQYNQKNHLIESIKKIKQDNMFLEIYIRECIKILKFEEDLKQYLIQQEKNKIDRNIKKINIS
ncbi:hypothetical protein ATP_00453 [Candidatus Phytoplasma mali]|uniref:Effector n=1 Tax=Phytoplasma mali (strain AT) TaxID=482235 RepID=B3R0Q6_PHYMT|nr:hypothetical protein [Candidatus Phytoplasma mali]CAP18640.1 hypothetical protein ATP_00453 [Candidatus Phytoplasma mali]